MLATIFLSFDGSKITIVERILGEDVDALLSSGKVDTLVIPASESEINELLGLCILLPLILFQWPGIGTGSL
jgi:hypothetical protein